MKFNYGYEKWKFEEEHRRMHDEYIAAGMSEEDYKQIYDWDWEMFKEERVYRMHNQEYESRFEGADYYADDYYHYDNEIIEWDSPIDQKIIMKALRTLTEQQRLVLRLYVIEGMTQEMIALRLGISQAGVADCVRRIKVKIKKFIKI